MNPICMRIIAAVALLSTLAGCSTVPYNPEKPVAAGHDFWRGLSFKQDGQFIDGSQMLREFRKDPRKAEELQGQTALLAGAIVLTTGGGFCLGYGVGKAVSEVPGRSDGAGLLIGVGVVTTIVGYILADAAENKVFRAVDLHNDEVKSGAPAGPRSELRLSPAGLAWHF